jgi:hypothetical protein
MSVSQKVPRWMLEVIAYFDQLGFLVITPLMPVIVWQILDRAFLCQHGVEMVWVGAAEAGERGKPEQFEADRQPMGQPRLVLTPSPFSGGLINRALSMDDGFGQVTSGLSNHFPWWQF